MKLLFEKTLKFIFGSTKTTPWRQIDKRHINKQRLSETLFSVGSKLNLAFVEPELCFSNDCLPAQVIKIKNNRVRIQWENGFSAVISPDELVVE